MAWCSVGCARELLWTLSDVELNLLEKSLCSTDDVDRSSALLAELSGLPPELLLSCDAQPLGDLYGDDMSDAEDDSATSGGVMVHSESTMTVVARPVDDTAAAASDTSSSSSSLSAVLSDAEARRLHHSKSWPQSAESRRAGTSTSSDGVPTYAVTVYGNQQFHFNLPHNTSTERLYHDVGDHVADQNLIYVSSPTSSVSDEPQIAYITEELCRIFCTDTASLDEDDGVELPADVFRGAELAASVDVVDLSASSGVEVSASMQQQCLPVISCDCDDVTVMTDRSSTQPTSPTPLDIPELPIDKLKLPANEFELPVDKVELPVDEFTLSNNVETLSSAYTQASLCRNPTDIVCDFDNMKDGGVDAEDVAIATLIEHCNVNDTVTLCQAADVDVKSSTDDCKASPSTVTDAVKCHDSSQACISRASMSNNVEPSRDQERCTSHHIDYVSRRIECRHPCIRFL